ncbi:MAG: hypothetical protein Q4E12_04570 [Coriobacteriia bacterium]|nr:hypothetical protein [Coriobacteriia bacterium]
MELKLPNISLTGKGAKSGPIPSKTTINLVVQPKKRNTTMTVLLGILGIVLIAAIAKFGFVDLLTTLGAAQSREAGLKTQLLSLQQQSADYEELKNQYASYAITQMTPEESALQDRNAVLDLISNTLTQVADVRSVTLTEQDLELQFANASLEETSAVLAVLEQSPIVDTVNLTTAKTSNDSDVISSVQVKLKNA